MTDDRIADRRHVTALELGASPDMDWCGWWVCMPQEETPMDIVPLDIFHFRVSVASCTITRLSE